MRHSPSRVAVLVAAALVLSATAVQAGEPAKAEAHHRSWGSRLQLELGLTDEQAQAIRQIHQREAAARQQHAQALQQARGDLRRLILGQADDATIEAKRAEVEQLLAAALHRRVNILKEITPLLTPEQREKYAALASKAWRHRQS